MITLQEFLEKNKDLTSVFKWQIFKRDKRCYICSLEIETVRFRMDESQPSGGYSCPLNVSSGKDIWFNIDHIIPRSKGGKTNYGNVRACCEPCNEEKADNLPLVSNKIPVPSDYEISILDRFQSKDLDDLPDWKPYYGF